MKLDSFYPIFDSSTWLERLVPLGIRLVQLRIKDKSREETRDEIRKAKAICANHHCQLVVNDYWDLALDEGCDFVHLGQEDLDDADLDAIRLAGVRLGISTHDKSELARALELSPDYIALGPVFPTILKAMKWNPQGLDKLRTWREIVGDIPLVAIGGLRPDRAQGAFGHGADIVSAVTDITLADNPEQQIARWIEVCRTT